MPDSILAAQRGGWGGGMIMASVNFDYVSFREVVRDWKGTHSYRNAAEAADVDFSGLRRFLLGHTDVVMWETVQKLCRAMRRKPEEFVR